jgi:hypothetical protein
MRQATPTNIAIDPITRERIRGSLTIQPDGTIVIRLPHRLESPNKTLWQHWRVKQRDRKAWEARLLLVIADAIQVRSVAAYRKPVDALGLPPVTDKRILRIERQVPSRRNFLIDTDNTIFSAKGLCDSLRAVGFIRDDASKWTELHVTQRVSDDRRDWTVIRIEVPLGVSLPLR